MSTSTVQITVRGLDPNAITQMKYRARQQHLSLNAYARKTLEQETILSDREVRRRKLERFFADPANRISDEDVAAIDEAVRWMDEASIKKQRLDDEAGF